MMSTALANESATPSPAMVSNWTSSGEGVNIVIMPKQKGHISILVKPLLERNNNDIILVLVPENNHKVSLNDWAKKLSSPEIFCITNCKSELGIRQDIQIALRAAPDAIVVDSAQGREDLIATAEASKTGTTIILCVEAESLSKGIMHFLGATKSQNIGIYASIKSAVFFDGNDKTQSIDFDRELRFELIDKNTPEEIEQCIDVNAISYP